MATIRPRRRADGSTGYTATIRIKRNGQIIHQESQTFSRRGLAEDWAKRREVELEHPGTLAKVAAGGMTVAKLVDKYVEQFKKLSGWQRSKQYGLEQLKRGSLGPKDATALTVDDLVTHVRSRRLEGAGPATAANDLTWAGVVLETAATVWGYPIEPGIVISARHACTKLKLIGKSKKRDRLPTYDELKALDAYFADREGRERSEVPMRHIMWFAIYSGRRQAEITRLEARDNDEGAKTGLVRDAKHPRHKEGNHRRFVYPEPAWRIMKMQPQGGQFLFQFDSKTIGEYFRRACKMQGIEDLHFHDLRHEATTRLFEQGLSIPQVAAVTLHESWNELKRYTHLQPRPKVFQAPFL